MTTEDRTSASFDEQAALEELERLQRGIEESRRRRGQTVDEFDAFLRSFGSDSPAHAPTRPDAASAPPPAHPSGAAALPEPERAASALSDRGPRINTDADHVTPEERTRSGAARRKRPSSSAAVLAAVVVVVIAAGALLLMRPRQHDPAASPAVSAPTASPAAINTPSLVPPAALSAAPASAGVQNAGEITALRPVWVRVTIDGQRVVERELKANERVPIRAGQTIVVRAGDAGAVRVAIGGQDQGRLGADGVVLSRTFSSRPSRQPAR